MSYMHCETTAWVDPYLLNIADDANLLDDDDDEQRAVKKKLTQMIRRRAACSIPRHPKTDQPCIATPEAVVHPVEFRTNPQDRNAPQYFTLVAVSNNTIVAITKNNMIHFFDQTNDIPVTSMTMVGQTPHDERLASMQQKIAAGAGGVLTHIPGVALQQASNYVDVKDVATRLFLDPMGRYAVVVFHSGINLLYHIRRADAEADEANADAATLKKNKKKKKKKEKKKDLLTKDQPHRFDIAFSPEVSGVPSFTVESIGWDEHNAYEMSTGEIILGSQKHGALVACRFESSGVAAPRHLFTFPPPLHRCPVHSIAMTREREGKKRVAVLVAMDHKLFYFRSTRSGVLESAFAISDLTVPETEGEMAFLAAGGGAASALPLKNFWALPAVPIPATTSSSSSAKPTASHAALDTLALPTSRVTIHAPHRCYNEEQLPLTFTWTYYDTIVQGVLMPFHNEGEEGASSSVGSGGGALKERSVLSRRRDKASSRSANDEGVVDPIGALRKSMRVVTVESAAHLIAAAEYAAQFDTESGAPPFSGVPGAPSTSTQPTAQRSLSVFGSPQARGQAPTAATPTATGAGSGKDVTFLLQNERVVRICATYFYVTITTQTKLYTFASMPCVPMPPTSSPWEVRNRLLLTHSLTTSATPPVPVVTGTTATSALSSGAPSTPLKLPPNVSLQYKLPDGCLDLQRDPRFINKLYLCLSRDIIEIQLPSLKRQFSMLLTQFAARNNKGLGPSGQQRSGPSSGQREEPPCVPYHSGAATSQQRAPASPSTAAPVGCHLDGSNRPAKSPTASAIRLLPFQAPGRIEESAPTAARGGAQSNANRDRSATIFKRTAAPAAGTTTPITTGSSNSAIAASSQGVDSLAPMYASLPLMRQYGASRFPLKPKRRAAALYADTLFHLAMVLARKNRHLLRDVQNAYGEYLFSQERYLEAAAWLGKFPQQGVDFWFSRFAQCADVQPLLLFCLVRTQSVTECGQSMFGRGAIEVSCLSSAALVLLLDRCNAELQAESMDVVSASAAGTKEDVSSLRGANRSKRAVALALRLGLCPPAQLLEELLASQKDLLPWGVVREALLRVGSEEQVFTVCRTMDQLQELLRYLLAHGRYFDALELVIDRSRQECEGSLCYDDDGYVHPGVAAHLWQSYGSVFMKHFPVRMVKLGWVPYGAYIGLDPLRLLPMLSRYSPRLNETNFEAAGSTDELKNWFKERHRQERRELRRELRGAAAAPERTSIVEGALASDGETCVEHVGITYLKHLIHEGYTEQAISNLLLTFLAVSGSDDELTDFILGDKSLDLQYALRACHQHARPVAIVYIYFALGHLQEAIQMALDHHEVTRAKKLVERVTEGTCGTRDQGAAATRQELWKSIVKYVATQQFGPKNALHLISESHNDVNVSHVIPHLSDEVMLSEFKSELLENVADFGRLMTAVKEGIEHSKADVELLRGDVAAAQCAVIKVSGAKRCDSCGGTVWSSGRSGDAVVFRGCNHAYHEECLAEQWRKCGRSPQSMFRDGVGNASDAVDCQEDEGPCCFLCSPVALRHLLTQPISTGDGSLLELPK